MFLKNTSYLNLKKFFIIKNLKKNIYADFLEKKYYVFYFLRSLNDLVADFS